MQGARDEVERGRLDRPVEHGLELPQEGDQQEDLEDQVAELVVGVCQRVVADDQRHASLQLMRGEVAVRLRVRVS